MKTIFAAAFVSLGLCQAPVAHALLANGSFELPDVADGNAQGVTPDGWGWAGNAGFVIDPAPGSLPAQAGDQFADIGNGSTFVLQQRFTVDVAGVYELAWYDNANAFAQQAPYRVDLGPLQDVRFDANEGVDGTWNARRLRVALTPGLVTLSFSPVDTPGPLPAQDRFIDDVSLSAVPLPAALWPMAAATLVLPRRCRQGSRAPTA